MEAFSFLKYWKGAATLTPPSAHNHTLIDVDDGPFFDLELALPDEEDEANQNQNDDVHDSDSDSDSDSDKEFKFTLTPSTSSNDRSLSLSPSDDLIIKGNLILNSEPNSKPQFTASLFKSATKLRVFMLGLKKSKPKSKPDAVAAPNPKPLKERKLFTVKFKVEEVPIVSLFTRDNSSRGKASQNHTTQESESSQTETETETETEIVSSGSDEKRLMRKYLKMVKPLYVRVSRRYAEKLRFSEQVDVSSPESGKAAATAPSPVPTETEASETEGTANVKGQKQGNVPLPASLRKHLGKGRSAPMVSSKRRDDSLLQQHDWIQGAILHCKRSFNASTVTGDDGKCGQRSGKDGDMSSESEIFFWEGKGYLTETEVNI
ncbi:putative membrane-associated kinase regulator 2, partial [Mucuna pruriens]